MPATFIVEDGTGKSNANSYVGLTDANQYVLDHSADAVWTGASDAAKEKALRLATQSIDAMFNGRWAGIRTNEDQALAWPRYGVTDQDGYTIDSDEIPSSLEAAVVELAIKSVNGEDLVPDSEDTGTLKAKTERVGDLERSVQYASPNSQLTYYRLANDLISGLLVTGTAGAGAGTMVNRA